MNKKKYDYCYPCPECGEIAFLYMHKPFSTEAVKPRFALWNGKIPASGTPVTCQECGHKMTKDELVPEKVIKVNTFKRKKREEKNDKKTDTKGNREKSDK